jgi:hypothetical protein
LTRHFAFGRKGDETFAEFQYRIRPQIMLNVLSNSNFFHSVTWLNWEREYFQWKEWEKFAYEHIDKGENGDYEFNPSPVGFSCDYAFENRRREINRRWTLTCDVILYSGRELFTTTSTWNPKELLSEGERIFVEAVNSVVMSKYKTEQIKSANLEIREYGEDRVDVVDKLSEFRAAMTTAYAVANEKETAKASSPHAIKMPKSPKEMYNYPYPYSFYTPLRMTNLGSFIKTAY